ncbi:Putative amidase [Cladobotryum mycophilum]|uniref:Amidase n=1 Tax=Cladobotryum mycophilum TaxID=491253 RepID=A0ABR0SV38_9HYPO
MSFPSLLDATLEQLSNGLANGQFTSVQLVKAYLARIEQVNGFVHAVTEINPDALDIAISRDEDRAKGIVLGPLHGIPVLVKNNIATKDKMNNTAGSSLLLGAKVPRDAFTVHRLRTAGAIILGKTNLSQWANYRSRGTSIEGWSIDGGQTLAAYHRNQAPGGSSSGSGVAVDLGLAWAALGTETDGSILDPAHRNGIVGIKPTVGLTSRDLVIPISEHFDTVGPMARTVRDTAYLLQAIAGEDIHDKYTSTIPDIPDYPSACKDALTGARIGVPWNIINQALSEQSWLGIEVDAFRSALSTLEAAGATIIEANFTSTANELLLAQRPIFRADFPVNLAAYLAQLTSNPHDIHSLADVRDKTREHPREDFPNRNTQAWDGVLEQGWDNTDPRFKTAYEHLQELGGPGGLLGALDKHHLIAVAMPTSLAYKWAAVVGAPAVTVPMGRYPYSAPVRKDIGSELVDTGPGVPFGMCFLGKKWSEADLIGLAYGFEQRTKVRDGEVRRVVEPNAEIGGLQKYGSFQHSAPSAW